MADLGYQADVNDANESSFDPVPAGEYLVIIDDSDYIDNKKGTGRMLKLTYQIIEGPLKGRKLFENLNLENQSDQAVQIAKRAMNAICLATGVTHVRDSAELHNIPFKIDVKMKESAEYGMQNVIRKHFSPDGKAPAPVQPAAQMPPAPGKAKAATGGKNDPPWARKK